MRISRLQLAFVNTAAAFILVLGVPAGAVAEFPSPYYNHQRICTRCCLPNNYDYGHDSPRFAASALATADAIQAVTWYDEAIEEPECWQQDGLRYTLNSLVPRDTKARNNLSRPVQRKPFHFTQASLTVNHIRLDQIGLSIYDTGHVSASGKVSHDGGPDGGLIGNNVTIRLRAFAAPVNQIGQLPINSTVVWENEHRLWVKRGPTQTIQLTAGRDFRDPELRRYFHEITHFEVELEYKQDR